MMDHRSYTHNVKLHSLVYCEVEVNKSSDHSSLWSIQAWHTLLISALESLFFYYFFLFVHLFIGKKIQQSFKNTNFL